MEDIIMKIVELEMNIMSVPQGYYLVHAISKDLNFQVGLPALFDKTYNLKEKLIKYVEDTGDSIELGDCLLVDNVFSLVVKESSYDMPDKDLLCDAISLMRDYVEDRMIKKIAMPKVCCGRNGLEWDEVKEMFSAGLYDLDIEILVCTQ